MFEQMSTILVTVLTMVALGAVAQWRLKLNLQSLVKLNLYVFVPAFLYVRVSASSLSWWDIGGIGFAVLAPMLLMGVAMYVGMKRFGATGPAIAATVVGGLAFNAGNFGIPVAELAFGKAGGSVQALVVMFVNTSIFFIGYGVLAMAAGGGWKSILGYFRLPMIYVIAAALIVREINASMGLPVGETILPMWLDKAVHQVAAGMVPIALITLGAQLVARARWPRWSLIGPVMLIKLAALPAATALTVWAMGLWPWPGAQLILAAAGPTAVNTLLLTVELDGDADTAADCVFWTTLACAVTVTVTLAILVALGGGPPT
ncbi:MAG: hypothetical protein GC159_06095 [Phycisphaera sp.]|nr:hypothetical protein [Phycisphaera sp.]